MPQLTLISAAIAFAIGFAGAWQIQSLRADSLEKQHAQSQLAQEQEARKLDQARTSALAAAQNDAVAREAGMRADADVLRRTVSRLRSDNATALLTARTIAPACLEPSAPVGELLDIIRENADETEAALVELDGKADRHVSDIKTLRSGWVR